MTTDFTGDDTWHATISGPADLEPMTGLSASDMGLLLADRTVWLKNRLVSGLRLLEALRVSSTTVAMLRDLKASTSFLDITGVTKTLANDLEAGDVLLAWADVHALAECDVVPTNRVELAIAINGTAVNLRAVSTEAKTLTHVGLHTLYVAVTTVTTPTINVRGRCSTASAIPTAEAWGPYDLSILHLRPVAAP